MRKFFVLAFPLALGLFWLGCRSAMAPNSTPGQPLEKLLSLEKETWPATDVVQPAPVVTESVGGNALSFWPYTGTNFSGTPQDPINLIFVGASDPRDLRAALMSMDGSRDPNVFPPVPPFNQVWADAIGDEQTGYTEESGWVGSVIQLGCGDYAPVRFHIRLFAAGVWTLANAHFEVLIPGTADHQVLSWELAEQFVIAEFMRSGLLDPDLPIIPTEPINDSPFRAIPAVIYNGLPAELRVLIGGPLGDVSADVGIATDGRATILNLADKADREASAYTQDFVLTYDQVLPKPFCAEGTEYLYVQGPVHLRQRTDLTPSGLYAMDFHAEGELTATPINPMTGEILGSPLVAQVAQHHASKFSDQQASVSGALFQKLGELSEEDAGYLLSRLWLKTGGPYRYEMSIRCGPPGKP